MLTGYRAWRLIDSELVSLVPSFRWNPSGVTEAICVKPFFYSKRPVPCRGSRHQCGLYAFYSGQELGLSLVETGWLYDSRLVVGSIEAWGRVQRHAKGFRAQFARVTSLGSIIDLPAMDKLRKRFGANKFYL